MSYVRKLKNQILSEPIILLKRPWLVFLIPMILVYIIINRLKNSETKVFLTETNLASLVAENRTINISDEFVYTIAAFDKFSECAQKRINEDCWPGSQLAKVIKDRFNRGDFALVYKDQEGALLSYVFICTEMAEFTPVGINLPLPAQTFGMYDVYTYLDSRGKGYYSHLFYYAVGLMQKKGYDAMWLWLMKHNSVSVSVHYKLGIENISKILTEKVSFGLISRNVEDVKMSLAELISNE
jgi:GNAT superfamily N-acetyltransferase